MLRPQTLEDLPEVLVIEQLTQIAPWSAETFEKCLQAGYLGWVIEIESKIIGFIMASFQPSECHILNLCIHPDYQQQGHGRKLLEHVLKYSKEKEVGMVFLEVRRSNLRAVTLYLQAGFVKIAERQNYYPTHQGREDALVFAKDLGTDFF